MSEFFNNPTSESRHFILSQNNIKSNLNLNQVLEYQSIYSVITKVTPTLSYFPNGYILNSKNTMGWFNVNFKCILGDLYDKYDSFYLRLNTVYFLNSENVNPLVQNIRLYHIKINGLSFQNITNSREVILTNCKANNIGSATTIIYPEPQYFKFYKTESAKIEINLNLVHTDLTVDPAYMFFPIALLQNNSFHFSIFPAY